MTEIPDGLWLNVGSGEASAEGWIHLDGSWQAWLSRRPWLARLGSHVTGREIGRWPKRVRYCDVRKGLPHASESAAVVYASHLIEHLYRDEAVAFLREAKRVLKPGGVCRIVVPDLGAIVQWYLEHRREMPRPEKASSDLLMEMLGLQNRARPGKGIIGLYRSWTGFDLHKWMYDEEGLLSLFLEAGFSGARIRSYIDSDIPQERLAGVEKRGRMENGAGICAESRK